MSCSFALQVVVVEYNTPNVESWYPHTRYMTPQQFNASTEKFDVAFSISSYEHDGLGRYGRTRYRPGIVSLTPA